MSTKQSRQDETEALRRAAEARLSADATLAAMPGTDLTRLVHELQVHQIELEMQNSELREARAELEHYRDHLEERVRQGMEKQLASEAHARLILQSSADGLFGTDANGLVTFINPAACALLGYTPEEVIGRNAHRLFHHSKPDGSPFPFAECPCHEAEKRGQEIRVDNEVYWHADGHAIPVMYAMHPIFLDGKVSGLVTSLVDMSEQRAAIRAQEMALIAARKLARLRSEFLANMSHEIRTPLNGILGFAEIGVRNYQDAGKALNAFNQILTSGKSLLGVINDILDFSKIEAGKLHIEHTQVTLTELIRQVYELNIQRAQSKKLQLKVKLAPDMPRVFLGDTLRLEQVLLNLIGNAVKFTTAGSITLSASRQSEQLEFKVADTGIGMDGEQLAALFQPFQQGDSSTTRKYGGTGLGLVISRRLLELMQGDISVESQLGVGTTFTFRVPYVAAPDEGLHVAAEMGGARVKPDKPLADLSVLVAEDDLCNQVVMAELLAGDGARVVLVNNGREAVERVRQDGAGAYDVVLMDVEMPEMNGYEATRQLLVLAPNLPVIGQTAHAMAEQKAQCLADGMVDHVAKPIDPNILVATVLRHVAARAPVDDTNGA
jgi:PAS domain S-box-containing protein